MYSLQLEMLKAEPCGERKVEKELKIPPLVCLFFLLTYLSLVRVCLAPSCALTLPS